MTMIKNRIKELKLVEWRKIKDLQPKNIKQIFNYSHIENSILQHGFAFPFGVYIDKSGDVYAIDGHTRIEVLSNMEGVPDLLPAFVIDAKDKKEAIKILLEVYNQRTNPIDEDVMREWLEVEEISIEEIAVGSLNVFGMGEYGGCFENIENQTRSEIEDDEYEEPSSIKVDVVLGDLITFEKGGNELHRLLCGDSTSFEDYKRLIEENNISLTISDPPFELSDNDKESVFANNPEGFQIWILDDKSAAKLCLNHIDRFYTNYILVLKNSMLKNNKQPIIAHCIMPVFNFRESYNDLSQYLSVFEFGRDLHMAGKGASHAKGAKTFLTTIENWTKKGDAIVDYFVHSGSIFVACHNTRRRAFGMEIEPKYCQMTIDRMVKLDPELVVKINGEIYK